MTVVRRDTSERRSKISAMMRKRGSVQVLPLAKQFGVSTQTIRKDLQYLVDKGVATRAYGGAICASVTEVASEPAIEVKRGSHPEEKDEIGVLAASLVEPGDSIILDSGTTTAYIARHLPDRDDITVVTNDFGVLVELEQKENLQIVMLGGSLRRKNMAFYGAQAEEAIAGLLINKLFLGVDGFDLSKGVTTHFEPEAILNRRMVEVARSVIAVTDSSKFNRMCLHHIVDIERIDILVTDAEAPRPVLEECRERGVDVRLAL
jgi:DeoR family transcriptional regulator of aga operon